MNAFFFGKLEIYINIGYVMLTIRECCSVGGVSVCPSDTGLRNVHFLIFVIVLDTCCQQMGDICQLEIYFSTGLILPRPNLPGPNLPGPNSPGKRHIGPLKVCGPICRV